MFTNRSNYSAHAALLLLAASWLALSAATAAPPADADTFAFDAQATLEPSRARLDGKVTLTLSSPHPIYAVAIAASSAETRQTLASFDYWAPKTHQSFTVNLPATHSVPGIYHLVLTLTYTNAEPRRQQTALGLEYSVGGTPPQGDNNGNSTEPKIRFTETALTWEGLRPNQQNVQLQTAAGPFWQTDKTYTPNDNAIDLKALPKNRPAPNWAYPQLARIAWTENGVHHSALQLWTIVTDRHGNAHPTHAALPDGPIGTDDKSLTANTATLAVVFLAVTVLFGGLRHAGQAQSASSAPRHNWLGLAALLSLTGWLVYRFHPELWFNATWATGGDVASHVFYASVFADWFWQGKISGWLPESFAGFPAFTFYFPFPFALSALLSVPLGLQSAFMLVAVAPAVLLPAATYAMAWTMGWPLIARWFATLGATAFLLTTRTTFWGGNALAAFTGEFSYGWGMLWAAVFLGLLHRALRQGGRTWILAALAEAALALCHGYPLLVIGFGSFAVLAASAKPLSALRTLLQVHTLAFLLIAAWLFPLIENLPWTLPNDTPLTVGDIGELWPRELWPLSIGIVAAMLILWRKRLELGGFSLIGGVALAGLLGFFIADRIGLAAARFFPLAQWALCVLLGGAIGLAIERWNKRPLLWALTATLATVWWCQPGMDKASEWAQWNLSGYESKPLWPVYRKVADHLKGPLTAPRVLFEHAPANVDTGSTRTLEALPLFGTRPMLEGLYMESAIAAPFIYQTQAEVSARPSSPSSRYPSVTTSVDQAIAHMQELYADTVLLRSEKMKDRFRSDKRLEVVAEIDPFLILKIKDFPQQLVEPLAVPLEIHPQPGWMNDAFSRFRLAHPYESRRVYLASGQTPPVMGVPPGETQPPAQAKLVELSRERLVLETNAIGQPHLIRMTYHPRWRSTTGEPVFLTEPSFMLVVPQQSRLELTFADSRATQIGRVVTVLGAIILLIALFAPRWANTSPQTRAQYRRALLNWAILTPSIAALCAITWWTSPERIFRSAAQHNANGNYLAAAPLFERASEKARQPPAKADALFWAARSYEMASDEKTASARYQQMRSNYQHTPAYPEAAYRLILLQLKGNRRNEALVVLEELEKYVPNNKWTQQARDALLP